MNAPGHIGQYRILRKIGAGGMGMVFLGEHLLIQRRAAIKTLQPNLSKQREIVERFFNEARATSAISDPGVVQVFDFGYHVDGTAYIVMELLEGEGLADRLDRLGTLPIPSALRIARQAASSLAAAHAKRIVHRDLKPENIFLIRDPEAQGGERTKILDFGICAFDEQSAGPTETMIGTPVYMSPEQCRGEEHDHRSDIYGLGCVLFQMLTGSAPFERDSIRKLVAAHLCEEPPPVSSLREDVPPEIDALVRRCLAKAPEDRFASMVALGAELERVLARLSAPELRMTQVPSAMPLPIGFRSMFDASFGGAEPRGIDPAPSDRATGRARPMASRPVRPRTMSSPPITPLAPPSSPLRRAALGVALLGGALLASFAARLGDDYEAIARGVPAVMGSAAALAPAEMRAPLADDPRPAVAPAAARSEVAVTPASSSAAAVVPVVAELGAAAPAPAPAPPEVPASSPPDRPPAPPPPAARSRRPARALALRRPPSVSTTPSAAASTPPATPAQPQGQASSSEDLYDTR